MMEDFDELLARIKAYRRSNNDDEVKQIFDGLADGLQSYVDGLASSEDEKEEPKAYILVSETLF